MTARTDGVMAAPADHTHSDYADGFDAGKAQALSREHRDLMLLAATDLAGWAKKHGDSASADTAKRLREAVLGVTVTGDGGTAPPPAAELRTPFGTSAGSAPQTHAGPAIRAPQDGAEAAALGPGAPQSDPQGRGSDAASVDCAATDFPDDMGLPEQASDGVAEGQGQTIQRHTPTRKA